MEKLQNRNYRYISFTVFLGLLTVSNMYDDFLFGLFISFANPYTIPIFTGLILIVLWAAEFISVQLSFLVKQFRLPIGILYPATVVFYIWLLN